MSDAPERTHYADDETLAYIRKLEAERDEALAAIQEMPCQCGVGRIPCRRCRALTEGEP